MTSDDRCDRVQDIVTDEDVTELLAALHELTDKLKRAETLLHTLVTREVEREGTGMSKVYRVDNAS